MSEPNAASLQEINEAITELRTEFDKKSLDEDKIVKINNFLDTQEEFNQKALTAQKSAEKEAEEFKQRIDTLEAELARRIEQPGEGKRYKETDEYKALEVFIKEGTTALDREMKALLRTDNDNAGGYLVMGEMDNAITKQIIEISGIRSIARVRTVGSKSLTLPIRKTIPVATYEGEAEDGEDSASSYVAETIPTYRLTNTTPITMDQLMDSTFDMETEILSDSAEAFAVTEGNKFVLGTGAKQPEGFLTNADVIANVRTSTASGSITADDVILLTGDLKVGYNPTYVMNRQTLAFLRTQKSTDGNFLWQPGLNGPVANTINGFPYILAPDMPTLASNAYSVAFGDFLRGYTIIDRTGVSVVRDEVTRKRGAIIEYTIHRWNNGMVTLPEAIKVLQCAA